jgi:hypothetical protein
VIQRRLPAALDQPPPFARFGNWGFAFAVFLVFLFALWIGRQRTGPDHK